MGQLPSQRFIFGPDYKTPGHREVFTFSENLIGGVAPGNKACVKKKFDGNEDAMGVIPLAESAELLLMADAHFGSASSTYVMNHFREQFERAPGPILQKLFTAHLDLDAIFNARRGQDPNQGGLSSSTTLLSVLIQRNNLFYCSTGDSRIFLLRQNRLIDVNPIHRGLFVGDYQGYPIFARLLEQQGCTDAVTEREQAVAVMFELSQIYHLIQSARMDREKIRAGMNRIGELTGLPFPLSFEEITAPWHPINVAIPQYLPCWGGRTLHEGDLLFMATDGIEQETSGCSPETLTNVLAAPHGLPQKAEKLLDACLGRRGGNDNLMFFIREC